MSEASKAEIWYPLSQGRCDVQGRIDEGDIEVIDADQVAGVRILDAAEMNLIGAYRCRETDWVGAYTLAALTSVRALRGIFRAQGLRVPCVADEAFLLAVVARVQFHDGDAHINTDFGQVYPMVERVRTIDEPWAEEMTQDEVKQAIQIAERLLELAFDVAPWIPEWAK